VDARREMAGKKQERIPKDTFEAVVNIKTKEILALEVTDEKVYDGNVMEQLVKQVLENKNIKIKSALGDGSYDSKENFKYLQNKKIRPAAIKVRKNYLSFLPKTIMQGIKRSQVSNERYS
jgi:hypothetical protein